MSSNRNHPSSLVLGLETQNIFKPLYAIPKASEPHDQAIISLLLPIIYINFPIAGHDTWNLQVRGEES